MTERYATLAQTTLASGYTAGSGSISVASAAGFPSSGTFRVAVNNGSPNTLLTVTGVSGTTFTVTAEANDANASSGDDVFQVLTAGAVDAIRSDDQPYKLISRFFLEELSESAE